MYKLALPKHDTRDLPLEMLTGRALCSPIRIRILRQVIHRDMGLTLAEASGVRTSRANLKYQLYALFDLGAVTEIQRHDATVYRLNTDSQLGRVLRNLLNCIRIEEAKEQQA